MGLLDDVKQEMLSKGYDCPTLEGDGKIKRFDRDGSKNAWCVVFEGKTKTARDFLVAIFGDWREGSKHIFKTSLGFSKYEQVEVKQFVARKRAEMENRLDVERRQAVVRATKIWNEARHEGTHNYLDKKQIASLFGARIGQIYGQKVLCLPMRNISGDMTGLQLIYGDGSKRFLKGQQNKGSFVRIPDSPDFGSAETVYLCEGFATGAAIYAATNMPVVCAMNAGNLMDVALELKFQNPKLNLVVAGDDDRAAKSNVGRVKATECAKATASSLVFPESNNLEVTDFSDLQKLFGIEEVQRQLLTAETEKPKLPAATILACQFLERHKMNTDKHRLVAWREEYFQFNSACYDTLIESDLKNDVVKFLQSHPIAWTRAGSHLANEVLANVEAMVNAKSDRPRPFWLDDPSTEVGDVICVSNGIVDLTNAYGLDSIELLPHNSELFQTAALPFKFDLNETCPTWTKFISEVIPDELTRASLQEWFGYNLVFDVGFQKFAIFYGQGANGKTVCCVVLRALVGEKNVSGVTLEAFDPKRTFPLAATVGRLANIVEELNQSSKTEEGELKKYVSGGLMTVERKGRDPFEMIPSARLTFATNTLPRLNDGSEGVWRRTLLFPFTVQTLDPAKQDRRLADLKFWTESGELPGILNWALEGLFRLRKNGAFTESEEMRSALAEFKLESNPTREFLLQECQAVPGQKVGTSNLYKRYKQYMEDHGYSALGMNRFCNEVKLTFPSVVRPQNAVRHDGIRQRILLNLHWAPDTASTPEVDFLGHPKN